MTPKEMFQAGIMGGSYFRPITSPDTGKTYKNHHRRFSFLRGIPDEKLCGTEYNKDINKYGVEVGTSYEFWMSKHWIREDLDPYGWIEWYCNFYNGRRSYDDERQIRRWKRIAGKNTSRFRDRLQNKINEVYKKDKNADIGSVYIGMRQTLLHWAFDSSHMRPQKK